MTIIAFEQIDGPRDGRERKVREALESWTAEGRLDPERSAALETMIRRQARRESWRLRLRAGLVGTVATAACCTMLVAVSPAVRTWAAVNVPVVGEYLQRWYNLEKGWEWAEQHQMFQEVLASRTHAGYTFRVHRVLADATGTTIIYTVEGPAGGGWDGNVRLDHDRTNIGGMRFLRSWSSRSEIIDGVRVGSMHLGALPRQSGTLRLAVSGIDDIQGDWTVSFAVSRAPIDDVSREVPLHLEMELAGGKLTIGNLIVTPVGTVLSVEFAGPAPGPQLGTAWPVRLVADDGTTLMSKGASMQRTTDRDGTTRMVWTLEFDPVPGGAEELVLRIDGSVREECEVRLTIGDGAGGGGGVSGGGGSGAGGNAVALPDGNTVEIKEALVGNGAGGGTGRAVILYTVRGHRAKLYEARTDDWLVVDQTGATHAVTRVVHDGSSIGRPVVGNLVAGDGGGGAGTSKPAGGSPEATLHYLELTWQLPEGRQAVELLCRAYPVPVEGLGEVTIPVPAVSW